MSEIITAVYENGVLRPLNPVNLTEGEKVRLRVLPPVREPMTETERALMPLVETGKLTLPPLRGKIDPVSEEELRERAERLGKIPGKPLSEIVIEDRGPY
ncbi:antitoxin family protein [Coleofasciculus sp. H7-2]|uniref:antitoxin family protein n=1 Tax=Coleofasciculus sp. H7-2 TaxID=3351545 RepID=UPI0036719F01